MTELAINGGTPVRTKPFHKRTPFDDREIELVTQAIRSQNLFLWSGTMGKEFERKFAELYGVQHAVSSTSGTAAIHLAVGTIDPNPGDEIITAPITDLGSVVPILQQKNAIPIFADIDGTYNMDPEDVERKITDRTKAIMVVHLFGNPANMDGFVDLSKRYRIPLIEDCSQAHVTTYKGKLLGTIGDIGCFSLQQSKHMTTGDGGVTITNNEAYYDRMRFFVDKGFQRKGWGPRAYLFLAPNYRMNELTAAVGLAQIEKVKEVVRMRRALGDRLTQLLRDVDGVHPAPVTEDGMHSYWMYPLRVTKTTAEDFAKALTAEGVPAGAGYIGKPIYLCTEALTAKKTYGTSHCPFDCPHTDRQIEYTEGMCPITEEALTRMVTFSFNENYTEEDIADIAEAIRKVAEGLR